MAVWPLGGPFFGLQARFLQVRDPTSQHCRRAKCIIGHIRPALFLVHFCSKFMVLVLKKLKIRVIASNLRKCEKKYHFWFFALGKNSKFDFCGYLSVFFLAFSIKYNGQPLEKIIKCLLKPDLGFRNHNFRKESFFWIFDLRFWKNICFILFFI